MVNGYSGWQVVPLAEISTGRWDDFVRATPAATFFHLSGWRHVIERAFGHASYYLYAEKDGVIGGVLPLFHVNSRLFSNALISTPFCSYGGVAARDDAAANVLVEAAGKLAKDLRVDYLEMRNLEADRQEWATKDLYATFRVPIDPDPDVNFKAIPGKQRTKVRRGQRMGLETEFDTTVDRHYDIYARMVRNLGTPVFSKRYFELLKEEFGRACEIMTITCDGRPVSSMMNFWFRDEMLVYYGGGTDEARQLKSNYYLYWELMRHAAENGAALIDYGRSKRGSGAWDFKEHWGWQPTQLHYEYQLFNRATVPNVSPANPKYRPLINAWKRLPVPLTRLIGPMIARNLG
ncbi:MAG TPA: FemAB family XrtA/PEP-CTERM system-associated protein [Gammaproteobacteria bacterium]|nr:FemAB family XrtA/PEP-CTERM system-associated protein [Gammaproteobacteria bacterium]